MNHSAPSNEQAVGPDKIIARVLQRNIQASADSRRNVLATLGRPQDIANPEESATKQSSLTSVFSRTSLDGSRAADSYQSSSRTLVWRFDAEMPEQEPISKIYLFKGIEPCPEYEQCTPVGSNYIEDATNGKTLNFLPFPDDKDFLPSQYAEQFKKLTWKTIDRNVQNDEAIRATANQLVSFFGMTNIQVKKWFSDLDSEMDYDAILCSSPQYQARQVALSRLRDMQSLEEEVGGSLENVYCENTDCRKPNCTLHVQRKRLRRFSLTTNTSDVDRRVLPPMNHRPCGEECYLHDDGGDEEILEEWSAERLSFLREALDSYPGERSCYLFHWCASSCREFHMQRLRYYPESTEAEGDSRATTPDDALRERMRKVKKEKSDLAKERHRLKDTFVTDFQERSMFVPCHHDGKCTTSTCSCMAQRVQCEYECRCDSHCARRFKGCQCSSKEANCSTEDCKCFKTRRECDPRLCHGKKLLSRFPPARIQSILFRPVQSTEDSTDDSSSGSDHVSNANCDNVSLQKGACLRTSVKEGSYGWGLFTDEKAKKGQFLGEYLGELLKKAREVKEEPARGHSGNDYGFEANMKWSINATYLGNETRFMNHSQTRANVMAKTLFVNGDFRVAFFAMENIEKNEELFFDYGSDFAIARDLED